MIVWNNCTCVFNHGSILDDKSYHVHVYLYEAVGCDMCPLLYVTITIHRNNCI